MMMGQHQSLTLVQLHLFGSIRAKKVDAFEQWILAIALLSVVYFALSEGSLPNSHHGPESHR